MSSTRVTGQPSESSPLATSTRVFVEVGGTTYYGYRIKPQTTDAATSRLVNTAYQTLADLLSLPWPPR